MATQHSGQVDSIPRAEGGRDSPTPPCTDAGNAELFSSLFRDRLCFDHGRQQWVIYRSHWWELDTDGELMRMAKQAVRARLKIAVRIDDDEKRQKEVKWAGNSESLLRLEAMLTLARSEKPLADDGRNWNPDNWLMGTANGIVDLRTGKLRHGLPDDRITLHTNITFDPDAKCPRWERFLEEVFDRNSDLIGYIYRAVGYSLTGETSEQCFFCCHGEGANGKSTFLNAVRHVLGSYALNLPLLYREFFTFKPLAKFWLAFNHPPLVADDSHGFWRRVHLIPFNRQFDTKTDPKLEETLANEAPGILAWAVRGCLDWQAQGLTPPAVVQGATHAYRTESDALQNFLEDRGFRHPNACVSMADLREAYVVYAHKNAEPTVLKRAEFTRRLQAMGFEKQRCGHDRTWTWVGIRLKEDGDISPSEPAASADVRADADVKLQ